jgi:hypothetical protein
MANTLRLLRRSTRRDDQTGEVVSRADVRRDETALRLLAAAVTGELIDGHDPQTWPMGLDGRPKQPE